MHDRNPFTSDRYCQSEMLRRELARRHAAQQQSSPGINRDTSAYWGKPRPAQPRSRFDGPDVIGLYRDADGVYRAPEPRGYPPRER